MGLEGGIGGIYGGEGRGVGEDDVEVVDWVVVDCGGGYG